MTVGVGVGVFVKVFVGVIEGVIDGVGNAARQLGISAPALRDRIRAGESGYAFLPNELLPLSQHQEHEARG